MGILQRVATAVVVGVVAFASLATPGYRVGEHTVSRLASPGAPHATAVRAAFVAYGIAVLVNARWLVERRRWPAHTRWILLSCGLGAVAAGIAQKDLPGTAPTIVSQVHVAAAAVTGAAAISVMLGVGMRGGTGRQPATVVGASTAALAGAAFPLFWGTAVYGTLEIIALVIPAAWLALMSGVPPAAGARRRRHPGPESAGRAVPRRYAGDRRDLTPSTAAAPAGGDCEGGSTPGSPRRWTWEIGR